VLTRVNWWSGNNFPSTYTILPWETEEEGEERISTSRDRHSVLFRSHFSVFHTSTLFFYSLRIMASSRAEGRRQEELTKERQRMREQYEKQKAALVEETEKARPSSNRFVGQNDSMEDSLKRSTVGLVKLEEYQARRKEIQEAKEREAAMTNELKYVFLA